MPKRINKSKRPKVNLGGVVQEELPYRFVHYPNLYGAFFGFSKEINSQVFFCSCASTAVGNYLKLKELYPDRFKNMDHLRNSNLSSQFFPEVVSSEYENFKLKDIFESLRFKNNLCHKCNFRSPTMLYCHPMYGGNFKQQWGWYVKQTYFRLGIYVYCYLPEACPDDMKQDIEKLKKLSEERRIGEGRLIKLRHEIKREEFNKIEIIVKSKKEISLEKKIENITRQELGFKKIGEGWVSELILYKMVSDIFHSEEVLRHYRPDWLERLELDIYMPSKKIAFEYQGQQHYKPIKNWGGEIGLKKVQERDAKKEKICRKQGITLIKFDYTEPLTNEYLKEKFKILKIKH